MARARVTFSDISLTVNVPVGSRLIEISEKVGSGIPYGCREGDCGTCIVKVEDGHKHLSTPSEIEEKILSANMAGKHHRLACQAQVLGDVTVHPA